MNSTKELIFSYFKGNISAVQRQTIARWAKNKDNEEQLYRWLEEFETLYPEYDADLETAIRNYNAFLSGLNESHIDNAAIEKKTESRPGVKQRFWFKWGIAAGVTLLLGLAAFLGSDVWLFKTYRTQIGERKDFMLPDGSTVSLGTNSSLRTPRWGFGNQTRDVYLVGEASFNVKHTRDNLRFIVKTAKRFEVKVLGTEFYVVAREMGSRVILRKGRVQLSLQSRGDGSGAERRMLDLKPGDVFTLDSNNNTSLKTTTLPEIRDAWQGHLYIFDKTPLSDIMSQLKEDHGIKAEFADPDLAAHSLSGKFTAESIDELFEVIQGILDIQITRHGDNVKISRPR